MNGMLWLEGALKREPAIDAWLDEQPPERGAIARMWFLRMRRCGGGCPRVDARRNVAGPLQMAVLPAADQPEPDLMPVAVHRHAIQVPIAIAHHHAVSLHHEPRPRFWVMLFKWRLMRLVDILHRRAFLACVRSVSLPTWTRASSPNSRVCLTKGGDGPKRRLPTRQTRARLLVRRQLQRLVWRAPAMAAAPAVVPPALQPIRTRVRSAPARDAPPADAGRDDLD
jgi:hypothetical protein